MLIKTIKHDLAATYREFTFLYLALVLMAIVGPFIISSRNEFLIAILFFGFFGMSIATLVVTFLSIIKLFSRRLFSDEGYLTLTLPVKTSDTVIAKVITGMIWSFATTLVFILSATIFSTIFYFVLTQMHVITAGVDVVGLIGELASTGLFGTTLGALASGLPLWLLDSFYSLILILFVITVVNTSLIRKNRVALGIFLFFVLSVTFNSIFSYYHLTPIYFNDVRSYFVNIMSFEELLFGLKQVAYSIDWADYAIAFAMKGVVTVLLSYGTFWLLDHKLELE